MDELQTTALKKSFFITLIYVGSGTLALLAGGSWANGNEFISDTATFILLLTLPVTCISFGIEYADNNAYGSILLVQTVMFILFWVILYLIMHNRLKKKASGDTI